MFSPTALFKLGKLIFLYKDFVTDLFTSMSSTLMIDSSISLNLEKSSMASCKIGKLKIRQLQETFIGDSSQALIVNNSFSFW